MRLDEAIENNKENLKCNRPRMYPDFAVAIQLGIEALVRLESLRDGTSSALELRVLIAMLLPSETE